jgi:hypothetical protein
MIEAMPAIVEAEPDVVYIVLGATHPNILRETGDAYRSSLQQRVHKLGLADHVIFRNQFVEIETLCQYLGAADVYVTPYLNEAQITSGTLAYAMGSGTAVVSTPYWHAQELLDEGRGRLVPFRDPKALASNVKELLSDEDLRHRVRRAAYEHTRPMVWKEVARQYLDLGQRVLEELAGSPKPLAVNVQRARIVEELPEVNLQQIQTMTDDTGILKNAVCATPDRSRGYTTDDNARALTALAMHYELQKDESVMRLMHVYLSFLYFAFNEEEGRFRSHMSYDRQWEEEVGSEDSHGRALWALGCTVCSTSPGPLREIATRLFTEAMDAAQQFDSPRALASSIIGLQEYLAIYGGDTEARRLRNELAERLHSRFQEHTADDWPWFEDVVTYDNAKVPHALLLAGQWMPHSEMYETGLRSLRWLLECQTAPDGHISVIGSEEWMRRDGTRSHFAQRPGEVTSLIEACVEAYRSNGDNYWLQAARRCFEWFLGANDLNITMYDFKTGGCHDALELHGSNHNQGAEACTAWLTALMTMHQILGQEVLVDESGLVGRLRGETAEKSADTKAAQSGESEKQAATVAGRGAGGKQRKRPARSSHRAARV